jgi:hypothetical protein
MIGATGSSPNGKAAPLGGTDGRHGITSAFEARLDLPSGVIRIAEALSRGRRRSGKRGEKLLPRPRNHGGDTLFFEAAILAFADPRSPPGQ